MLNDALIGKAFEEYWKTTLDMAFIKDANGLYVDATPAFVAVTRFNSAEELRGKTDFEIFTNPELARRYVDDDARLLSGDIAFENYIEPFTPKDGRPRYCATTKRILRDENGEPIGIFGVSHDITPAYEARQSYENELKNLFELPPDVVAAVMFDITAWRIVDTRGQGDASAPSMPRYRRIDDFIESIVGRVVEDEAVRDFYKSFTPEYLRKEYQEGKKRRSFEYLRSMDDGSVRWVRDELHFLLDPVNSHLSLIIVLHDIDASKRAYEELLHAAERDSMTGLLNHDATVKCIKQYLSDAGGLQALFMIDLDNFKQVNDSFGHQQGDDILAQVGEAISGVFRSTDIIGRVGGDEFMVLMKDVRSEEAVRRRADALIAALQFTSSGGEKTLDLTTSVGAVLFLAEKADFNVLYSRVDAALYRSKGLGKNRYTLLGLTERGKPGGDTPIPALEKVNTVQLQTLLEYMDGGVVMAELHDEIHITYVSPSLYRTFHRVPDTGPDGGQSILMHVLPEDLPGLNATVFATTESEDVIEYVYRVRYEGRIEWRRIRAKRIPESGDGVRRLVAVVTDISDLKYANEHLREAEARYRIAVEQTEAMLWEVDIPTRTLKRTGAAWSRFPAGEAVFHNAPESYINADLMHPESIDRLRQMFDDLYAGDDSDSYYFRLYAENREEIWVEDRFKLLRDEDGTPYCALGITQLVPNINAEMQSFAQEMRFFEIIKDSLLGYIRINFTQNLVEIARVNGDDRYMGMSGLSYEEFYKIVMDRFVYAEDAEQFAQQTSRGRLLARFREGENWKLLDYRRIGDDGSCRWTSLFIKLMRHPISGDVYAFCYQRDNEVRHNWEMALNQPITRNATLQLYSQATMEALAESILATRPGRSLAAVSVLELVGLDRVRNEKGEAEARELLFTFGRLCRIAIKGDVIIGQLGENRAALMRADAGSNDVQRERVVNTVSLLNEFLHQAHPEADVNIIGGFAVERVDRTTYAQLLRRADIACQSAAKTLGESAVAYVDTGLEMPTEEDAYDLAARYRALALRYQQQANMLRVSENDELTGILGKAAFYRRVRETLTAKPERKLAIVRFDINRFKVFNDVRGIAAGDRLLCDIAAKIREDCGTAVLYARLESDHFALLVPDDEATIQDSAERLTVWLMQYAPDFRLSASIGVYRIDDANIDVSLMCDRALLALRSVKSGFDTKLAYYNYTLRYRLIDEQQLVNDMENALKTGQFVLYFQPQVNYETGELIGAEALVRWNHPKRGLLAPNVFIPLLERNGLITRLDEYVWERCCQHIRDWLTRYPQASSLSLSVSVNVSRIDIYDTKLCETLKTLIDRYRLPTSALRLEITESAYMENPQQLIDMVRELQEAGFTVEMDDFGSGYSSLNTLKDVAVDVLKLDMKFLADSADSSRGGNILSSVIRMAHWLKLPIIAEGVETKVQADYLKSLGCVFMQGYYFDQPMPAARFEELFSQGVASFADRYRDTSVEGMAAFWDPSAQMALLFNSFIGGAAVMEYTDGILEVLRVNDNYYKTLGTTREEYLPVQTNLLDRFDEKNKAKLLKTIQEAIETGEERACELESLPGRGNVKNTWMHNRIRLLAQNDRSAILYVAIEDITKRKRMEREQAAGLERDLLLMQTTGLAFFDYVIAGDVATYRVYLPDEGITERVIPNFSEYIKNSAVVTPESAETIHAALGNLSDTQLSGELEIRANLWNTGMRWCRMRFVGVEDGSGHIYRWVGQVDDVQDVKDRANISESLRRRLKTGAAPYAFNTEVVEQIFGLFYSASDIGGAIETTLSVLGEYYDLSRAYIFEDTVGHTAFANTFEWCAPDVEPQIENLQYVAYDDIGGRARYIARFDGNGAYYCADVSQLSPGERAVLEPQGIRSMIHYAIWDNGVFGGIVGFDECREIRNWTEEQAGTLMFVSRIIASNLLRLRQYDHVAFSADLRAALDDNAEYIYIIDPETYEIGYTNKAVRRYTGADCIGKACYRQFIGRDEPCPQCPVPHINTAGAPRTAEVVREDGMVVLSHASPLRWGGKNLVMLSCVDVTERGGAAKE